MNKIEKFRELVLKDKKEYDRVRKIYHANPVNWTNNKRRLHGLPTLRGYTNKNRNMDCHYYWFSAETYALMEEIIDDALCDKFIGKQWTDNFVTVNGFGIGKCSVEQ